MRVLYGVCGMGMGHATRSIRVIEHLRARHEVTVVASGDALGHLRGRFEDVEVYPIWGLRSEFKDNRLSPARTLWTNLRGAVRGIPANIAQYFRLRGYRPDVVVTDFETWTHAFGKRHGVPVIALDNIHALTRFEHDPELLEGHEGDARLARSVIRAKIPGCYHYLVSTFYDSPVARERTTRVPPIIREAVRDVEPRRGEHLLVYQSAQGHAHLPELLKRFPEQPVIAYGLRRDIEAPVRDGNIVHKPLGEGFVEDLASARAVMASAGFSLISEALHLRKPYLAVPLAGQFEQVLNGRHLERMGVGATVEGTLDDDAIRNFLLRQPSYESALAARPQGDERALWRALDGLFDTIEAGLARGWRGAWRAWSVRPSGA